MAFNALGPLGLAMVGVISLAPVLAQILQPVVVPVYQFLGADPAMFATTLLANDMGGYPLAKQLAIDPEAGLFAGIILGAMMGPTIVFSIPVALGLIKVEDRKYLAMGVLAGMITIPIGCVAGGLVAGWDLG
jgi:ethanolamine transporter